MDDFTPSHETLAAIAARHGVSVGAVGSILPGAANHVYALGDDLVLRVPRTRRFLVDLVKEAAVIPAARRAGVRTPDVVAFDDTCSWVDVPYMVLERAAGEDLAGLQPSAADTERVLREVGRELARLHRVSPDSAGAPAGVPVDDDAGDPRVLVRRLRSGGWIDSGTADWLTGWFERLSVHLPADPPRVLVHGDIAAQNLLVRARPAALTGIVDWGDAQWADPATEFAKIPLTGVAAMLDGYRQETGEQAPAGSGPRSWEARVLRVHLTWALYRVPDRTPQPGRRHWSAPPAGRLLGLLRFFASGPPSPWAELA
ncbi:phosphotransferase family protein [Embleya sp. NPDC127516]|uniref:phosphotransferase family protein n=1 Tax=Embleya sp. NPDC127516 TaxID=3363990 RepID=UPI003822179C